VYDDEQERVGNRHLIWSFRRSHLMLFSSDDTQDIARISHRDAVDDLLRKGRILEKNTLVTAVKAHLEDRIIVYKNKCVVFGGQ